MHSDIEILRDKTTDRLFKIYTSANTELIAQIQSIIAPNAVELADYFYTNLMAIEDSHSFLNHEIVSARLHRSMAEWIKSLFLPSDERTVAEHVKWQQIVGDVHARVNVPMKLVNHGIRLLKVEMGDLIKASQLNDAQKYRGLVLINDLLDFSSSLINESYISYRMVNERDSQALRMHIMSFSLVVELERLRSSLFDWLRRTVTDIYGSYPETNPSLTSVYTSDFGLWVIYKAEMLFSDRPEIIEKLKTQLELIQSSVSKINALGEKDSKAVLAEAVEFLNDSISNAAWMLGDFSAEAYEMETGRDPLTRLFNRRFLPSVMQNIIKASKSTNIKFSILSCDIDQFKKINDQYGHEMGDQALIQFGEVIATIVRATDYVFRMGGDEFLVILAGADSQVSTDIAKKILEKLNTFHFELSDDISGKLQTSIGLVEYDGHPDYLRMIKSADEALYKAKSLGKNMYFIKH
jgi:diguanylate cyclase